MRRDLVPPLAAAGVVLIWGVNFSVIKAALADFEPLAFNALRFALASAVVLAVVRARGPWPAFSSRERWALVGLGLLGNVAYQVLFILGIDRTRAGNTSLLLETVPILTALLSVAFGHERLGRRVWLGIGLSFVGAAVVVAGSASIDFGRATVRGDLLVLAAALGWATYTVAASPLVRRHGAVPVTAAAMWVGAVGLLAIGAPSLAGQDWSAIRPGAWAGLGYSGVFAIAVAYLLWYELVGRIGSTRTAILTTTIPVVALAVAWPALGEVPTPFQLVGAAAIVGGVILAQRRTRPETVTA